MSSKALNRKSIFSAARKQLKRVDVPEWGGAVYVRAIKACEFEVFQTQLAEATGSVSKDTVMNCLVTLTACDAHGKRLFTDDDTKAVGELGLPPVLRVFRAAMKLNNLDENDVDELVKN